MLAGSRQALLSTGSEHNSHGGFKLKVLLGTSCLFGMMLLAYRTCAPGMTGVQKVVALSEQPDFRFHSHKNAEEYYWSSNSGNVGGYLKSPYAGPPDIRSPSWTWYYSCCPFCKWCTIPLGTAIDGEKNIYLTSGDGIRKFTQHGQLLWTSHRQGYEEISKAAVLMDGAAYCISGTGRAFAVSMETGKDIWSITVSEKGADGTNGGVAAHNGVVLVAAQANPNGASDKVFGLNGTDGNILWSYSTGVWLWNFRASFLDDGTFIYQDVVGGVWRQFANNGTVLWRSHEMIRSWTDGQANLGPDGIVYGVKAYGLTENGSRPHMTGALSAYRLSDGHRLWYRNLSMPPNSVPATGMLVGQTKLSVVIPFGYSSNWGEMDVIAFDAVTGEEHWIFNGPLWTVEAGLNDLNYVVNFQRMLNGVRPITLPNVWGMPVIDGEGNVFVGGENGNYFRLRDLDGDGKVSGPQDVQVLATEAGFEGSAGSAIAPGVLATCNAQSLLVWNYS